MAACTKCLKNVGCGCNLVNGLCANCRNLQQQQLVQPNTNLPENLNAQNS